MVYLYCRLAVIMFVLRSISREVNQRKNMIEEIKPRSEAIDRQKVKEHLDKVKELVGELEKNSAVKLYNEFLSTNAAEARKAAVGMLPDMSNLKMEEHPDVQLYRRTKDYLNQFSE